MNLATELVRMHLTRSVKPFVFHDGCDESLPFAECEEPGLYVHIPFCKRICGFCPYCKVEYSKDACDRYVDALLREIELAASHIEGRKRVGSLYFGGGTPALAANRMKEIVDALSAHFEISGGVGVELHPDNVVPEILQTLKEAGATKLSIGVQSFQPRFQRVLGRAPVDAEVLARALSSASFETVSMDFIFALPGQTFDDLRRDVDAAFEHGANHVAIYPFIDFPLAASGAPPMPRMSKKEKRALLDAITEHCERKGRVRTSIWTFSSDPKANYSSMTRETFLGFGCSATTLLKDRFTINTFSVDAYCDRIASGRLPASLTLRFTRRQRMVYWLFWTAYGMEVDAKAFERFFGESLEQAFGLELKLAKLLGFIKERKRGVYSMTRKGVFHYHCFERFYTLAYIDKMWGIMRKEAFPKRIAL